MRKLPYVWMTLAFVFLILINTASVIGALAADPEAKFERVSSAEVLEGYPRYVKANGKEIFELKYEVRLHDMNDSFIVVVDKYYAEKLSILWSNGEENEKPARVELEGSYEKGHLTKYKYQAKYNNDYYYILFRFKLSNNQVFIRKNLGKNINLSIVNIPFFLAFLFTIYQVEKTTASLPSLFSSGKCSKCGQKRKYKIKKTCLVCTIHNSFWSKEQPSEPKEIVKPDLTLKKQSKLRFLKWPFYILAVFVILWLSYLVIVIVLQTGGIL